MKHFRFIAVFLGLSIIHIEEASALNSLPWAAPSSLPLKASIEKGVNFQSVAGAFWGHGKGRDNLFSPGDWETGWTSRTPYLDLSFSFAPTSEWEIGLQVPIFLLASTINVRHSWNSNFGAGVKLGPVSSTYIIASYEPSPNSFISLSPAISVIPFDYGRRSSDFNASKFTAGAQLAFGLHRDPTDIALLISYDYSLDGDGLESSFVWDEVVNRHLVKTAIAFQF